MVKDGTQIYGFCNWKMIVSFPQTGSPGRGLEEEIMTHLGNLAFEVPLEHPNGDVKLAGGYADPEFS